MAFFLAPSRKIFSLQLPLLQLSLTAYYLYPHCHYGNQADKRDCRLNLTVASRIHLIEPQWNPMVEVQAIGRAHRYGQTKKVLVFRYIMEGTIEEVRDSFTSPVKSSEFKQRC